MSETISVTTYSESAEIAVPKGSEGEKSGASIVPGWGDRLETTSDILVDTRRLVRRDVPVDMVERELQKLIDLMNRIFLQAEQSAERQTKPEESGSAPIDKKRLRLNEVSLEVEISADGGVSILGAKANIEGKGGITLKFTRE